jgi:ABC-type branched-subunit amino acid transport system ATPase component
MALNQGRILAMGTAAEVQGDEEVIRAYIGAAPEPAAEAEAAT